MSQRSVAGAECAMKDQGASTIMTSRRRLVASVGVAATAGFAIGHFRVPLRARLALAGQSMPPPIDSLEAYRRQRLESFFASRQKADVVMLGDSITESGDWSDMLPGSTVLNRGIRGDTSADVLARLDEALSHGAGQLYVMVGINDIVRGVPLDEAVSNVEKILVRARVVVPKVTMQSVLPVAAHFDGFRINPEVTRFNRLASDAARRTDAAYLDLWPAITPAGVLAQEHAFDGLHLSPAGYGRWRDALLASRVAGHGSSRRQTV